MTMTIKDLFKQMEKANEFAKMVGEEDNQWHLEVTFENDWWFGESFDTYKDFSKWFKKEYRENFVNGALESQIEMEEGRYYGKGQFSIKDWWKDEEEHHIIKIHFYRK